MTGRRTRLTALVLAALLAGAARGAPAPARVVSESEVHEVAGGLRCVVCQNLSVADSPSEMARQMRAIVRERLEAGESPGEVVQYFVDRYGEWILLSPRRSGFNLLVWAAPLVAVAVGLAIVSVLVRRWARAPASSGTALPVDPAMRERIRRETEAER
ncbi:MAG: cytochrome C biogenesis protein CcdA [Candidatus Rokuibacteriota bacterium]|nr:MAG: cytochrome C biogenesis protein CcdA [Candidatus Rokubacteria bacterium]PYN69388.1 MAG: cytochrome C biogenesis protein CcdA [Candidatus Rokubacteria bacterium]